MVTQRYDIIGEFNVAEALEHLDVNYIYDMINDKLSIIDYSATLNETNIVGAFEENFKYMNDTHPGDSANIRSIRSQVYTNIINVLCEKFNLEFNKEDENINLYSAAYYLYEFLICKRNEIMINFFISFIVANKDSLCTHLDMDEFKKSKDSASAYSKHLFYDQTFALISANIPMILNHITTLDISLYNIFQTTYNNAEMVAFMDNAFADKGMFFKDQYCEAINKPDVLPIIITNMRLQLQRVAGIPSSDIIHGVLPENTVNA